MDKALQETQSSVISPERSSPRQSIFSMRALLGGFAAFLCLAVALHYQGFHSAMVYDSREWIAGKIHVFSTHSLLDVISIVPVRPLFMTSLYLNYLASGMEPASFRWVNAIILAATGLILAVLSLQVYETPALKAPGTRQDKQLAAFFVAAWFVVHPLQSFVVLYIWQREAMLACFFFFSSMAAYFAARSGRLSRPEIGYCLTAILFLAGLMCKENVATLPIVLIIAEMTLWQQPFARLARQATIIAAICAPVCVIYFALTANLHGAETVHPPGALLRLYDHYKNSGLTPVQVALTESRVLFSYLGMILLPFSDPLPFLRAESISVSLWNPPSTIAALAGMIALGTVAAFLARRRPVLAFGILFFLVTASPESLLIPTYLFFSYRAILPMAGVLLVTGWGVLALLSSLSSRERSGVITEPAPRETALTDRDVLAQSIEKTRQHPMRTRSHVRTIALAGLAVPLICMAMVTYGQAKRWSPLTFWQDSLSASSPLSHQTETIPYMDIITGLGGELIHAGRYAEAIEVLGTVDRMDSVPPSVLGDRGPFPVKPSSDDGNGEQHPLPVPNRSKKASALINLGLAFKKSGDINQSILQYCRVILMDQRSATAYNNLGNALEESGDMALALPMYRRAVELAPALPELLYNLASALQKTGNTSESVPLFQRALAIRADYPEASANLGVALLQTGRTDEAIRHLQKATAAIRDNAELYNALGAAQAEQGLSPEAATSFKKALAIKPDHVGARENLRTLLREMDHASQHPR